MEYSPIAIDCFLFFYVAVNKKHNVYFLHHVHIDTGFGCKVIGFNPSEKVDGRL